MKYELEIIPSFPNSPPSRYTTAGLGQRES
jgi:hypothetical protein